MESLANLFFYITPYLAVVVFAGGIAYRLYTWRARKPVPANLSLFPRVRSTMGRWGDALVDMFTLKGLWRVNKPLWVGGFIMHLGLLLLLLGHVRTVTDYYFIWDILNWGEEQQSQVSHIGGTIAGILFMVPLFYLLGRRFSGAVKWLSTPEDYLILFLLIGIAITGNHMRFLLEVDAHEIRDFMQGLFLFRRAPIPTSASISFVYHFVFVQLLMIYFPFSKLSHTIGTVLSKMVVRS
jgi:nitrate reductase gamma subunit